MQIVVVVLISLAEWYATLGPHLFHFKSLDQCLWITAMLVLYGVNYQREWNRTFCKYDSAFIEPLLYIYLYICFWNICCS